MRDFVWSVLVAAMVVATGLSGCAISSSHGNKISAADVSRIVKGKTTRAELDAWFGPPLMEGPSAGAAFESMLVYGYYGGTVTHDATSFVPIVGAFAGSADTSLQQQSLTVFLTKNGVVKDYQFQDKTTGQTMRKRGLLNYEITPR